MLLGAVDNMFPNRSIPSHLKQSQQVYHNNISQQYNCNPRGSNDEQISKRDYAGTSLPTWIPHRKRYQTGNPDTIQWISRSPKKYFQKEGIYFQLIPLHLHCTNGAERLMVTFNDHLVTGLSSTDPSFPMYLWCRLIPDATTTLNLLHASHLNPRISAQDLLNGVFDS